MSVLLLGINFALEVNEWMETLDKRYLAKQKTDGAVFPKKERINGSNSKSLPPPDAPEWALDKEWVELQATDSGHGKKGDYIFITLHKPNCICYTIKYMQQLQ